MPTEVIAGLAGMFGPVILGVLGWIYRQQMKGQREIIEGQAKIIVHLATLNSRTDNLEREQLRLLAYVQGGSGQPFETMLKKVPPP